MHKDLMSQLEETEIDINNNMQKAKQYIDLDKRYMAKLHLRRKNLLVVTYGKYLTKRIVQLMSTENNC